MTSATTSTIPLRDLGHRVLVIATSHTGNNVFCTPAIGMLKKHYPDTRFDVLALNRLSAEVFEGSPDISQVHITERRCKVRRLARNYNDIISLNPKSNYLLKGIKTPHLLAPAIVGGTHHAEQTLRFVAKYIGCQVSEEDRHYRLGIPPSTPSPLDQEMLGADDVIIGMHLGIGRTSIHGWKFFYRNRATHRKLWPLERYIELGRQLGERIPGSRIVLTGTRNEFFLGKEFADQIPGTVNLMGKTSVPELSRLMAQINLFISQDSGVIHIASASGVPLLGLYGPTNPADTGPFPSMPQYVVLKKDSMESIGAAEVADAATRLLRRFPQGIPH